MNDDAAADLDETSAGDTGADDAQTDDAADTHDAAVLAADATGMLAGERFITEAEIHHGLGDAGA